jgi:hypothetical protein
VAGGGRNGKSKRGNGRKRKEEAGGRVRRRRREGDIRIAGRGWWCEDPSEIYPSDVVVPVQWLMKKEKD